MLNGTGAPFAMTVDYADHAELQRRATTIVGPSYGNGGLRSQLGALRAIVRAARRERMLLLNSSAGSLHPDVLACIVIGMMPRSRRPEVVMMGCMWDRTPGVIGRVQQLVVRAADRGITRYALQTTEELTTFPELWGVDPSKTRFCPYFATMDAEDLDAADAGDHVFAGGNSHRDYAPLVEAARRMPDVPFVLATHRVGGDDLPANVTAGPVPHERFVELMRTARVVVVPLRAGLVRGTGQQTYLNAMAMGKAVVVSAAAGVGDYVTDGETGLIVEPTPEAYVSALRRLLSSEDERERLGARARAAAREQYTYHHHVDRLLEIVDE